MLAPAAGTVSFAGTVPSNGKTVTIQTADGYAVTLVGLGSIAVKKGAVVSEGQAVGTIAPAAGDGTPANVHLGIRIASDPNGYVDPQTLLPPRTQPVADGGPSNNTGQPQTGSGDQPVQTGETATDAGADQSTGSSSPGDQPAQTGDATQTATDAGADQSTGSSSPGDQPAAESSLGEVGIGVGAEIQAPQTPVAADDEAVATSADQADASNVQTQPSIGEQTAETAETTPASAQDDVPASEPSNDQTPSASQTTSSDQMSSQPGGDSQNAAPQPETGVGDEQPGQTGGDQTPAAEDGQTQAAPVPDGVSNPLAPHDTQAPQPVAGVTRHATAGTASGPRGEDVAEPSAPLTEARATRVQSLRSSSGEQARSASAPGRSAGKAGSQSDFEPASRAGAASQPRRVSRAPAAVQASAGSRGGDLHWLYLSLLLLLGLGSASGLAFARPLV